MVLLVSLSIVAAIVQLFALDDGLLMTMLGVVTALQRLANISVNEST